MELPTEGSEPALGRLADRLSAELAHRLPRHEGRIERVRSSEVTVDVAGLSPDAVLEVLVPEGSEESAVSLVSLGRLKVVASTPTGTRCRPVAPLTTTVLAPGMRVMVSPGPRRIDVAVHAVRRADEPLARALTAILPGRFRRRGFLATRVGMPPGSVLDRTAAIQERLQLEKKDLLLNVILTLAVGRVHLYAELVGAAADTTDLLSFSVLADDHVAYLYSRGPAAGLQLRAVVPLPARPLGVEAYGSTVVVALETGLLRFRFDAGELKEPVTIDLPGPSSLPVRSKAVLFSRQPDGLYLQGNFFDGALRLDHDAKPLAVSEAPLAAAVDGTVLRGGFEAGTDLIAGSVEVVSAETGEAVKRDLPFSLLRAVPFGKSGFILLTSTYDLLALSSRQTTPLTEVRTGYAFDVAYDTASGKDLLASSSVELGADRVTLRYLSDVAPPVAAVDLAGAAEAIRLADLDDDGNLDLIVAVGGRDGSGLNRLLVYATLLSGGGRIP